MRFRWDACQNIVSPFGSGDRMDPGDLPVAEPVKFFHESAGELALRARFFKDLQDMQEFGLALAQRPQIRCRDRRLIPVDLPVKAPAAVEDPYTQKDHDEGDGHRTCTVRVATPWPCRRAMNNSPCRNPVHPDSLSKGSEEMTTLSVARRRWSW